MATYRVRLSTEPGRLAIVYPADQGVMDRVCQRCRRSYGETLCIPKWDGLPTHGLCAHCLDIERARLEATRRAFAAAA